MNDHDRHRFTNDTYSTRNSSGRLIGELVFFSAGTLASIFLFIAAVDVAPKVLLEVAHVARPYDPVARYDMARTLWDQKLDRLIENLTPD